MLLLGHHDEGRNEMPPPTEEEPGALPGLVVDPPNELGIALPGFSINRDCSHDKAYFAIILTVIPFGALLTALIIFALIAFHKSIRSTKIYDNCTNSSANYVYHIELRTGDTSATYNRRKATITIDMFDDNQATLARIAVPGHLIFGRKESPIESIEDDRFAELRVTRLWLYRATQLKRVSTIRLTHTCSEPEARIMVYGLEFRTNDEERHKLFFPVMNYITAYGTENRPNACFDLDPIGSISAMGQCPEASTISDQLSAFDYATLVYLFCAIVFYLSTMEVFAESFTEGSQAAYKGVLLGCICFAVTFLMGLFLRFIVKHYRSLNVGRGGWAAFYYAFMGFLLALSTALWIYTTYLGYKELCSNQFNMWLLSICVAIVESIAFVIMCATIAWMLMSQTPVYTEFVTPDESSGSGRDPMLGPLGPGGTSRSKARGSQQQQQQQQQPLLQSQQQHDSQRMGSSGRKGGSPKSPQNPSDFAGQHQQVAPMNPWQASASPISMQAPPGYGGVYGQPYIMMAPAGHRPGAHYAPSPGFPTAGGVGASGYDTTGHFAPIPTPFYGGPPHMGGPAPPTAVSPAPTHTLQLPKGPQPKHLQAQTYPQAPNYQQQMATSVATAATGATGGIMTLGGTTQKKAKKVGSNESTGSTYYQQLMKNKGGVKSISQYGELLKKNKK